MTALWEFEGGLHNFTEFSTFRELSSITFPAPRDSGVAGLSKDPGSKYGTVSMDVDQDGFHGCLHLLTSKKSACEVQTKQWKQQERATYFNLGLLLAPTSTGLYIAPRRTESQRPATKNVGVPMCQI